MAEKFRLSPDRGSNADWTKRTWDLPPIGSKAFKQYLKRTGMTMEEFKKTPAYTMSLGRRAEASPEGRADVDGSPDPIEEKE